MSGQLALTAELVALVQRVEPDPGPEPGTRDHTEAEQAAMAEDLLAQHRPVQLWVFAYGSLIWNPEFDIAESRPARVAGWHRSFCLRLTRWRGTREFPGLMMALDRGGSCQGVAFRLPPGDMAEQVRLLLDRELDAMPPTNVARWIRVRTGEGELLALAMVADPSGPAYVGRLPLPQVANVLANAAGHWGTMADYLHRTVLNLEEHGLRDRNLWRLQEMVAGEISGFVRAGNGADKEQ